jgi:hypothetical protein
MEVERLTRLDRLRPGVAGDGTGVEGGRHPASPVVGAERGPVI